MTAITQQASRMSCCHASNATWWGFVVNKNSGKVVIRANVETLPHHRTSILVAPNDASTTVSIETISSRDKITNANHQATPAAAATASRPLITRLRSASESRILPTFET